MLAMSVSLSPRSYCGRSEPDVGVKLCPDVTEEQLARMFRRVGEVTRVTVRSVSGSVCSTSTSSRVQQTESRVYATVEFKSSFAAARALSMNGTPVNKVHICVSITYPLAWSLLFMFCAQITQDILKLPEFQTMQKSCEEKCKQVDTPVVAALQGKWNALK